MRTIIAFSVLMLLFCIGCSHDVPKPERSTPLDDYSATPDSSTDKGPLVEELVPRDSEEFIPSADEEIVPSVDPDRPDVEIETTGIVSEALGKYAAETVPLPPAEDLTAQVDAYIAKIGESLEFLEGSIKYAEDAVDVVRDAHALALVALALGLAEADSPYKKHAAQIILATKPLAVAKNFREGTKRYEALKASLTAPGEGSSLTWTDKVADLAPAMKAVPNLHAAVKRVTDTERKLNIVLGGTRAQSVYSQLAALAVIAQGTIPNVAETLKPEAVTEWKQYCEEFRDAALKANAAVHQYTKDKAEGKEPRYADFDSSFKAMTVSCDHCHTIFHPAATEKTE